MLVAYVLEHIIGLAIALAYFISMNPEQGKASYISRRCLEVFHDCSAFLAFSIQIAAIVVLVKVDFGLGTENMGDATVRITQAVSVLTLLPLAYATVLMHYSSNTDDPLETLEHPARPRLDREFIQASKRFVLLIICGLLSLYPFYSKMNSVFGPSKIGTPSRGQPKPVMSSEQFAEIERICYKDVQVFSKAEDRFMTAVAIIAYIPLSLLAYGRIIVLGMRKHHSQSRIYAKIATIFHGEVARRLRQGLVLLVGAIPLLASGLLWTVIRVQNFQKQMASAVGNNFADGHWTFGQVVAVTVFVPVLVEAWFCYSEQRDQEGQNVDL